MHRKQLTVFFILVLLVALSAFVTYPFFLEEVAASAGVPLPDTDVPAATGVHFWTDIVSHLFWGLF